MKSKSFLTLHRQQKNYQGPEGSKDIVKIVHVTFIYAWEWSLSLLNVTVLNLA